MPTQANLLTFLVTGFTDCLYTYLKGDLIEPDGRVIEGKDGVYLHQFSGHSSIFSLNFFLISEKHDGVLSTAKDREIFTPSLLC